LGVASVVSGRPYEATAETQEPSEISFLRQCDLLRLMRLHGELALWVTQHISQDYASTCREIRDLILSDSAGEKLARLLVGWLDQNTESRNPSQMKMSLTHEEIGQMIGTSRETVSRLFAGFKKQHLIQQSGSILVIPNRLALESLITAKKKAALWRQRFTVSWYRVETILVFQCSVDRGEHRHGLPNTPGE
jgi:CRP/FNR family transcriptional regulator